MNMHHLIRPELLSPDELALCDEIVAGNEAYLLTGATLSRLLGYPSLDALNRAVCRARTRRDQTLPVFTLPGRRGLFGWAPEISRLVAARRALVARPQVGDAPPIPSPRTTRVIRKGGADPRSA